MTDVIWIVLGTMAGILAGGLVGYVFGEARGYYRGNGAALRREALRRRSGVE